MIFNTVVSNKKLSTLSLAQGKNVTVTKCNTSSVNTPLLSIRGKESENFNFYDNDLRAFSNPIKIVKDVKGKVKMDNNIYK